MAYYPMFVFFNQPLELNTVAEIVFYEFAAEFEEFGVVDAVKADSTTHSFNQADQALAYLKDECPSIQELWCASDYNQIIVRKASAGYFDIEFLDFDSEIYDEDGPNNVLQQEKRMFAIKLHAVLIEKCGALLSYTLASDSSDAMDDFLDEASNVCEILQQGDYRQLDNYFRNKLYIWLAGVRIDSDIYRSLTEILSLYFQEVNSSVFEHGKNQPYFMC